MLLKQKALSVLGLFQAPALQEPIPTVFVPRTDEEILSRIQWLEATTDRDMVRQEVMSLRIRLDPSCMFGEPPSKYRLEAYTLWNLEHGMWLKWRWGRDVNCSMAKLSLQYSFADIRADTWLLGDDLGNLSVGDDFGKSALTKICEYYGWDYSQWQQ